MQTVYLGPGDRHETKYESMGQSSKLRDLDAFGDRSYTGLPLSMGGCQYFLKVYPSSDMEDDYITSRPITFTVAAVLIFVFTSVVFLFYDLLVERRQKKVMSTGKSGREWVNISGMILCILNSKAICVRPMLLLRSCSVNCDRLLAVSIQCARPIVPC